MTTSVPYSLQVRENRANQKNVKAMYDFSLDAIRYISTSEKDKNTTFPFLLFSFNVLMEKWKAASSKSTGS